MTLWFILALMTVAAVFAVLWPLSRRPQAATAAADVAVYRDQLDELERDRAAGLIGAAEAEAARVEIARRLIAAADTAEAEEGGLRSSRGRRRVVTLAALIVLPVGVVSLYLAVGSPQLPGAPLSARLAAPPEARSIDTLVAQVEAHLERNPNDGRGWEVIAPVYMRLGRFDDAVKAWRNALQFNGASAAREADYGEALVAQANGVVTADGKAAFERARSHDAKDIKARYFLGIAAEQDGRRDEAAALFRGLLADATPDAPWAEGVRRSLARVDPSAAAAPGPNASDIAAADNMAPENRDAMVRGMVERLATRLKQDGADLDGWVRLVRAYTVLGEPDKAKAAAADARSALAADPDKVRRLDELAKTLGL
jgi:cytochrome c-type biogenesis protein CcmH